MPACVCGAWKKGDSWLSRTLGRAKGSQMAPAWGTITAHRSVKSGFRGRGGRGLAEAGGGILSQRSGWELGQR